MGDNGQELQTIERLSPGTPLRQGLERIIQQGKGAILVLGYGPGIRGISSGGFELEQPLGFSPAKLSELSKMDGGIILDEDKPVFVVAPQSRSIPPRSPRAKIAD